jgi:hypothetical protein
MEGGVRALSPPIKNTPSEDLGAGFRFFFRQYNHSMRKSSRRGDLFLLGGYFSFEEGIKVWRKLWRKARPPVSDLLKGPFGSVSQP